MCSDDPYSTGPDTVYSPASTARLNAADSSGLRFAIPAG